MRKIVLLLLLPLGVLHGRIEQDNFAFTVTGSLGLVGEYFEKSSCQSISNESGFFPFPPSGGGRVILPRSVAASFSTGFEFSYTGIPLSFDSFGYEVRAGVRLGDVPYFWGRGQSLIQTLWGVRCRGEYPPV